MLIFAKNLITMKTIKDFSQLSEVLISSKRTIRIVAVEANDSHCHEAIERATKETGKTIIPLCLFINEKGLAKMEIAVCQGKHTYDKRQSLREADDKRQIAQLKKQYQPT